MDTIVKGLLNGKRPPEEYSHGVKSQQLAEALAARIESCVAPSLCAHAMCSSASIGNISVVRMLASLPKSKFNKAYDFSEPLRRAIRPFVKKPDDPRRDDYATCAKILVAAKADLHKSDKYSRSGNSAARILKEDGSEEALRLLKELEQLQKSAVKSEAGDGEANLSVLEQVMPEVSGRKRKAGKTAAEAPKEKAKGGDEAAESKRAKNILYSLM